ncbi:hypothetical protein [Nesterenkonia marinintestina]|uniref:hypothetical protein n=1 Tax=Nesterenkonia marinintestina TaxID=2979865 RepID=UPI0021BE7ED1|nr:hypothetical protein [Nesterenkonia sp. GX14115]
MADSLSTQQSPGQRPRAAVLSLRGERPEITVEQFEDGCGVSDVVARSACRRGVGDEGLCL